MVIFNSFAVLLTIVFSVRVSTLTVHTENGILNGTVFKTARGRIVNAFLGVPYAKPPVLDNRFSEPQPSEKWDGIRSAHQFGPKCIQMVFEKSNEQVLGDEDCLYLNIFTPTLCNASKLDIIFYIHGGAFMFGSGDEYTPDYLLDYHDIVFVTINYRLGPFGFLTTEDGVIPGNNGLKDQVMALKWIKNNIEKFGGDRRKVTIAGLSAGGASVHLHYLSNLSRNLFSQGISLSGSALSPWALTENSQMKAQMLASSVGCPTDTSHRLLECLKMKDAKSLILPIEQLFMPWNFNPFSPFGPVIESSSPIGFLTKDPYEILSQGDMKDAPWLVSITTDEGLYPASTFVNNNQSLQQLDKEWDKIAPHLLDYNNTINHDQLNEVSEKIKKFYFNDSKITSELKKNIIQMLGDRLFIVDVERAARLQASVTKSPIFIYNFGYRGKYSFSYYFSKSNDNLGACHGDDILYLLGTKFGFSTNETEEDRDIVDTMVGVWASFAETGLPSVNGESVWIPVCPDAAEGGNISYLLISSSKLIQLRSSVDLGNHVFWDSLPLEESWNIGNKNLIQRDEL